LQRFKSAGPRLRDRGALQPHRAPVKPKRVATVGRLQSPTLAFASRPALPGVVLVSAEMSGLAIARGVESIVFGRIT